MKPHVPLLPENSTCACSNTGVAEPGLGRWFTSAQQPSAAVALKGQRVPRECGQQGSCCCLGFPPHFSERHPARFSHFHPEQTILCPSFLNPGCLRSRLCLCAGVRGEHTCCFSAVSDSTACEPHFSLSTNTTTVSNFPSAECRVVRPSAGKKYTFLVKEAKVTSTSF